MLYSGAHAPGKLIELALWAQTVDRWFLVDASEPIGPDHRTESESVKPTMTQGY